MTVGSDIHKSPCGSPQTMARYIELLRRGHVAWAAKQKQRAHDYWRQAALLCPNDEQVWLVLLNVVEEKADRRVCLENIIRINPRNQAALQQLRALDHPNIPITQEIAPKAQWLGHLWASVFNVLLAIALGIALAIGYNLIRFGSPF